MEEAFELWDPVEVVEPPSIYSPPCSGPCRTARGMRRDVRSASDRRWPQAKYTVEAMLAPSAISWMEEAFEPREPVEVVEPTSNMFSSL